MYKKKSPTSQKKSLSPWLVSASTVVIVYLIEYFFSFPSSFLHSDFLSTLRDEPIACTQEYAPLCGKDGQTYANSCYAKAARASIAHNGACDDTSTGDNGEALPITVSPSRPTEDTPSTDILTQTAALDVASLDTTRYRLYENTTYGYKLALPKYAYYQGGLSADKKSHILAIDTTASGAESVDTALIRMIYQPSGAPESYADPRARISLANGATVILEYDEPLSSKGQEIADAILSSIVSTN